MFYYRVVLTFLLFVSLTFPSDNQPSICGMESGTTYRALDNRGGVYITAEGNLYCLVVFVQFPDDTVESPHWPLDSFPDWAAHFVNEETGNNFPYQNLSEYFYKMSTGIFELTGYVYPNLVYADHPESYYSDLDEVNYEILNNIDPNIDYSEFDNWTGKDPGADGIVDMIFMIYRNFSDALIDSAGWTGRADLSLTSDIYTDGVTIVGNNLLV